MTAGEAPISFSTPLASVRGVGPLRERALGQLELRTVGDLLVHYPLRYEHLLPERDLEAARPDRSRTTTGATTIGTYRGEVISCRVHHRGKRRFEAILHDGTGSLLLTWFNMNYIAERVRPGVHLRVTGRVRSWNQYLQITNPKWEIIPPADVERPAASEEGSWRAVYPASEFITSAQIERVMNEVLEPAMALVTDHLPPSFLTPRELLPLNEALRAIHRPRSEREAIAARRRLVYDELLLLQLAVMMKRRQRRSLLRAPCLRYSDAIERQIRARIPFALTGAQQRVTAEIVRDVTTELPMNRLVQGDVGSGKTVVALHAMLLAVASGHQAAMLAPTELLAEQHEGTIRRLLDGSSVRTALLTGSLGAAARRRCLEDLEAGEIDLLIGTHALLTGDVTFRSLALAVIDEQHRFGVHQRALLRTKGSDAQRVPHTLVMTATPIPRTLALTIFGDLDVSTIDELPPGRTPIETRWMKPEESAAAYRHLAAQIDLGAQAYVVVPVIEESDSGLTDLRSHMEFLRTGPLAARRLAAVHGRMSRGERDEVMQRFRAGEIDVLVATTVIEVGVDVPRASVMVIEHAERFGLAQLHQLRGRVGRGAAKSFCLLIGDAAGEESRRRREAICGSTDGFVIAEQDLQIRGPGEIFGSRQSGLAPFRLADFPRDLELLQMARRDAAQWIDQSPALERPEEALLRRRLLRKHGVEFGIGDVG